MLRLAVAFMWSGTRTVCGLRLDGQPSDALWTAAGVRWRGPWQASGASYAAGDAVGHEGAVWRAVGAPVGVPGVDAAWLASGEADLLDLVGRRLVAENDGVRSSGLGAAGGPAGSTVR
jgi:hypothetical protein